MRAHLENVERNLLRARPSAETLAEEMRDAAPMAARA
jgi:hypothetical protein